jgi:hypothetical protein
MVAWMQGAAKMAPTKPLLRSVLEVKRDLALEERRPVIGQQLQQALTMLDESKDLPSFFGALQTSAP